MTGSILSTSRMFSLCFAHLLNAQATTKSSESVSILALFSLDFSASSLHASQSSSRGILCSQRLALSQATQRGDAFSAPPPTSPSGCPLSRELQPGPVHPDPSPYRFPVLSPILWLTLEDLDKATLATPAATGLCVI